VYFLHKVSDLSIAQRISQYKIIGFEFYAAKFFNGNSILNRCSLKMSCHEYYNNMTLKDAQMYEKREFRSLNEMEEIFVVVKSIFSIIHSLVSVIFKFIVSFHFQLR